MRYIIPVLTFFLTQCDKSDEIIIDSRLGKADQESWGVTILLTDEGLIKAKIKSGHLEKYNEREFILLDSNVTVDFFDEDENHTSTLMCNIAEVNEKSNRMKAIGNVSAISDSGITLYTDTLVWNSLDEKMSTDCEIMLTTEKKDTLYGVGFESNSDLKNWVILNPSGVTTRSLNER